MRLFPFLFGLFRLLSVFVLGFGLGRLVIGFAGRIFGLVLLFSELTDC